MFRAVFAEMGVQAGGFPEEGVYVASSFVHSILLLLSVYHGAFSLRNPTRVPFRRFDVHHHVILSLRIGCSVILALIPLAELINHLHYHVHPPEKILSIFHYVNQVLVIAAWLANAWSTILLAKNCAWFHFHWLDFLLQGLTWGFVFVIQAIRFDQYVFRGTEATTEDYTTTLVLCFSLFYFLTLMAFHSVAVFRRFGLCLTKYEILSMYEEIDAPRDAARTVSTIVSDVATRETDSVY
ncbi:hypothetical protein RvY_19003 [Ramazzottius varieornatus]|uniref:Uncharacterized protein n=1 Tax=Ramazzottius varieornatus TaxID=947166 RepID=A0A1D1W7U2_RAMVA|nr:hypothetical protein RvY_19003 [Ramazzottius varieornatus]